MLLMPPKTLNTIQMPLINSVMIAAQTHGKKRLNTCDQSVSLSGGSSNFAATGRKAI